MVDWRLQGQETYLMDAVLERKPYRRYSEHWDHDHCEFCSAKFCLDDPDALRAGHATPDNYRWICDECFADFRAMFRWKERAASGP